MLTPAISASSTSSPLTIIANAFSTQVLSPPFLNRLPFDDETTMGLLLRASSCWRLSKCGVRRGRRRKPGGGAGLDELTAVQLTGHASSFETSRFRLNLKP